MSEWWERQSAEEIVDDYIRTLYAPQFPSASLRMHITNEETLAKVRGAILRAEVADAHERWSLSLVAVRPA